MIVYDSTVSERYAQALFNIVKRNGDGSAVQADAKELQKLFQRDSKLSVFLEGPQFATEDKTALLKKSFGGRLHPLLEQFIHLTVAKGRMDYIRPVLARFIQLLEADQGVHEADVSTAAALADDQRSRLQQALERFASSRLRVRFHVDPSLIAGVRFTMGDMLIDDSVKGKLEKLRFQFQEAARG